MFLEYLQTEEAMKVFEEYGFSPYTEEKEEAAAEENTEEKAAE